MFFTTFLLVYFIIKIISIVIKSFEDDKIKDELLISKQDIESTILFSENKADMRIYKNNFSAKYLDTLAFPPHSVPNIKMIINNYNRFHNYLETFENNQEFDTINFELEESKSYLIDRYKYLTYLN